MKITKNKTGDYIEYRVSYNGKEYSIEREQDTDGFIKSNGWKMYQIEGDNRLWMLDMPKKVSCLTWLKNYA